MELFIRHLHRTMECLHPTGRGVHFQFQPAGTIVSEVPEVTRNGKHLGILEWLTETPACRPDEWEDVGDVPHSEQVVICGVDFDVGLVLPVDDFPKSICAQHPLLAKRGLQVQQAGIHRQPGANTPKIILVQSGDWQYRACAMAKPEWQTSVQTLPWNIARNRGRARRSFTRGAS